MAVVTRTRGYQMSDEHKQSLAMGREQSRIVKNYLTALEAHQPKRGRKRTPESVQRRLTTINTILASDPDPLTRLQVNAEKALLERELERLSVHVDLTDLERSFVEVAAAYGRRKGIPYAAWRESGVPSHVLRQAGIQRSA